MKNYRELRRLSQSEWEQSQDWKGKRLAFIWLVADARPDLYRDLTLSDEKYDFYAINDPNILRIAQEDYYSSDYSFYEKKYKDYTGNFDTKRMASDYLNLENVKKNNFIEYALKKNRNLHDFLYSMYDCFSRDYNDILETKDRG